MPLSHLPTAVGSHGRMTETKLKYSKFAWLLHTQYVEVVKAETPSERAKELADTISVCIQWLEDDGFDPKEVYFRRADEESADFASIVKRYESKFGEIVEEMKT